MWYNPNNTSIFTIDQDDTMPTTMLHTKVFLFLFLLALASLPLKGEKNLPVTHSDSLTLAQVYINLTLTNRSFDTLSKNRFSKILAYEKYELAF